MKIIVNIGKLFYEKFNKDGELTLSGDAKLKGPIEMSYEPGRKSMNAAFREFLETHSLLKKLCLVPAKEDCSVTISAKTEEGLVKILINLKGVPDANRSEEHTKDLHAQ